MTNTVLIKRSSVANSIPLAGNLQPGELAINYNDGNLFYKNTSNTVTVIASNKFVSVSGNITGGNVITGGVVSTSGIVGTGNINFVSSGNISLGNVGNIHISGGTSGYVLSTNGSGNLSWVAQSGGTGSSTITVDDFTGDGSTTQFTLSVTPTNLNSTTVNYNGVIQLRTGYTLSGANIVFSTPPVAGSSIEVTSISVSISGAAGSNTQVQFNAGGGNLGASSALTFDTASNVLSVVGNIAGTYFIGNGSLLTGIAAGYSNTNVATYLASGTDTSNIVTTANISGGNILTAGVVSASGAGIFGAGLSVTGNITATGNINYQNITDLVVGDPLIYIGANNTADLVDLGIVASANVAGTYQHLGVARDHNTGIWRFFSNVVAEPTTVIDWANSVYAPVSAGAITSNSTVSASGNITGGNLRTAGLISAAGNITGGNLLLSYGIVSASGMVYDPANVLLTIGGPGPANIRIDGLGGVYAGSGRVVSAAGNVTGGNINTGGLVTATGNITSAGNIAASYFIGNGSQLTGITSTVTPAGSNTQIQFNDGGSLGASANLTFDKSTDTLNATTVTANGAPLATTGKAIAMAIVFGF